MENKKATKTQITTLTGIAGVLLTILADTINNINYNIFTDDDLVRVLKIMLFISVSSIAMCTLLGMIAFAKIQNIGTGNNNDPEKVIAYSHKSLVIGILAILYGIVIIITNNIYLTILGIVIFILATVYVNWKTKENIKSQPPAETEE